ncbi:sodium channel and clathrin linker 1-like [Myxocyprinus asiaticus]|uniref:sodium channel and clathrin linker 1-like n=1 Tax=Myxocyprinus asiaticus TaxID=70543 RepID=UPI0022239121|nr:sodium channel and clathrin linker 1-like [Myxocyprinus asiaticus]
MTRLLQNIQDQMQRREEDAAEAHGREEASDQRLQQLQTALNTLEARCLRCSRSCVKEQGLESRLREMEESSKNSSAGLSRLLLAQQKTISCYKEEAKQLTQAFQQKLSSLRSELNRQKQQAQELEIQLEADHQKILEYERQVSEHQEKNTHLQRRLTQAEQRAASKSQQLSVMSQRRGAASMMDLETLL